MGTMQKLWAKPVTNSSASPRRGDAIHEKTKLSENHKSAQTIIVRAARIHAP